jgi:O-methyltransferase
MNLHRRLVKSALKATGWRLVRLPSQDADSEPAEIWQGNADFSAILPRLAGHTLVTTDRLFFLYQLARSSVSLPGDFAEVGVYKGGTAWLLAKVLENSGKTLHLFDTFAGMPEVDATRDNLAKVQAGIFADTSLEAVQDYLKEFPRTSFYKGLFPGTATPVREHRFSLAYIDVDIYQSTKDCLEFFYPRVTPGGVIVSDDYKSAACPGVEKAFDEFFADKPEVPVHSTFHQCFVIRQ